jgi:hypothetical protein
VDLEHHCLQACASMDSEVDTPMLSQLLLLLLLLLDPTEILR